MVVKSSRRSEVTAPFSLTRTHVPPKQFMKRFSSSPWLTVFCPQKHEQRSAHNSTSKFPPQGTFICCCCYFHVLAADGKKKKSCPVIFFFWILIILFVSPLGRGGSRVVRWVSSQWRGTGFKSRHSMIYYHQWRLRFNSDNSPVNIRYPASSSRSSKLVILPISLLTKCCCTSTFKLIGAN